MKKINYLLFLITLGVILGLLIGIYQKSIYYITLLSNNLYQFNKIYILIIFISIIILFSFINYYLIKKSKSIDGSGIPIIELGIRDKVKIEYKISLISMFINSLISTFIGMPLGSEGPSVVLSAKLSSYYLDLNNKKDNELVALASGIGFGSAFLSISSGISYFFEESLHKFKPKLLIKALIVMVVAFLITSLINTNHLLLVSNTLFTSVCNYYIFIFIILINVILGVLFIYLHKVIKKNIVNKYKNNFFIKYRSFFLIFITVIINFSSFGMLGSGSLLIKDLVNNNSLLLIGLTLLIRYILILLCSLGGLTGGLVLPIMSIGALNSHLLVNLLNIAPSINIDGIEVINLISSLSLFCVITKTPFTSLFLYISTMLYSTNFDFLLVIKNLPIVIITIYLSYILSSLFKVKDLYEEQIDLINPLEYNTF